MTWVVVAVLLINGQLHGYRIEGFNSQTQCEAFLASNQFDVDLAYLKQHERAVKARNPQCTRIGDM